MAENPFGFRLVNIDIVSKTMLPQPSDFKGDFFNFNITTESSVSREHETIFNFLKVSIKDGNKPQDLAIFTIVCMYYIFNFSNNIKMDASGLYSVNPNLEQFIKSFTISTSRGIIWSELRGTYLHTAVMPVIDVTTLINKPQREIINEKGDLLSLQNMVR